MATSINWPTALPRSFLPSGFRRQLKDLALRTQPDVGRVRVRRRSTQKIYIISGRLLLRDVTQLEALDDFYFDTLGAGSKSFNWVDPLNKGTALEMIFTESPTYRPQGPIAHIAAVDLEAFPSG